MTCAHIKNLPQRFSIAHTKFMMIADKQLLGIILETKVPQNFDLKKSVIIKSLSSSSIINKEITFRIIQLLTWRNNQ